MPQTTIEPFRDRSTDYHGVREFDDWRLRLYSVSYGGGDIDWQAYQDAWPLVSEILPRPAATDSRPGVGFAIAHQGRDIHYLVVVWWDNENEMPVRLFVRPLDLQSGWRKGRQGESFCVYDMAVMWQERNAYIASMMSVSGGGIDSYLNRDGSLD